VGVVGERELQEQDVPPEAGVERRLPDPPVDRPPALVGDGVELLVGALGLLDAAPGRQAAVDEPGQGRVDLRLGRCPVVADAALHDLAQVVPGQLVVSEQAQDGGFRGRERHRSAAARTGSRPAK
jgi:hypothetical protein